MCLFALFNSCLLCCLLDAQHSGKSFEDVILEGRDEDDRKSMTHYKDIEVGESFLFGASVCMYHDHFTYLFVCVLIRMFHLFRFNRVFLCICEYIEVGWIMNHFLRVFSTCKYHGQFSYLIVCWCSGNCHLFFIQSRFYVLFQWSSCFNLCLLFFFSFIKISFLCIFICWSFFLEHNCAINKMNYYCVILKRLFFQVLS